MRKDNTPNYSTKNSHISHFSDFNNNIESEHDELKSSQRSFSRNEPGSSDLVNKTKYRYNKVTHKMDDDSLDMTKDKLSSVEDITAGARRYSRDKKYNMNEKNENEEMVDIFSNPELDEFYTREKSDDTVDITAGARRYSKKNNTSLDQSNLKNENLKHLNKFDNFKRE